MISRLATKDDIQGILALQEINLFSNLSDAEKEDGFVTTPFTILQLEDLLKEQGLFVTQDKDKILGYTMAASWQYFSQWAIFPFMISRLTGTNFNGITISDQNTFEYGPICIDASLRGTNAFPRLFEAMRIEFSSQYSMGITFINQVNDRSYKAHIKKLGMVVVDKFEFSDRNYYALAFDTAKSVLQ